MVYHFVQYVLLQVLRTRNTTLVRHAMYVLKGIRSRHEGRVYFVHVVVQFINNESCVKFGIKMSRCCKRRSFGAGWNSRSKMSTKIESNFIGLAVAILRGSLHLSCSRFFWKLSHSLSSKKLLGIWARKALLSSSRSSTVVLNLPLLVGLVGSCIVN